MAKETGGKYYHAGNEKKLLEMFEKLAIELHDDGIDEESLTQLAERDGRQVFLGPRRRQAAQLLHESWPRAAIDLYGDIREPAFQPRRHGSRHRHQHRANGVRLSNVGSADYIVPGVLVPEMDHGIYLGSLILFALFLFARRACGNYIASTAAG